MNKPPYAIVNFKYNSAPREACHYFQNPDKVLDKFDGLELGSMEGKAEAELVDALLAGHHDRSVKRVCRSAVISVQTPENATEEQRKEIAARLLRCSRDLQRFLKVASMLGWCHGNTKTLHMHLLFPNSNGRRTLNLTPKLLREIQDFKWTREFLSGRGKGKRGSLSFNPKAPGLKLNTLAAILMDQDGKIVEERWERLVSEGHISEYRYRKNGSIISFMFGGKRMRIDTLRQFILDRKGKPMKQNEVSQVEQQLAECGWTSEDVQEVLRDIREGMGMESSPATQLIEVAKQAIKLV